MEEESKLLCDHYLRPTFFVDSDSPEIIEYARNICKNEKDDVKKAIRLFYAVRNDIIYDLFGFEVNLHYMKASYLLKKGSGYCVSKALVLAACARAVGIPSRLGFADVINHLNPGKLHELMQTNIFAFHGFAELYLQGRWVKATPSFDPGLCEKSGYFKPEFDGINDTVYPAYNKAGKRHMEYVHFYGSYPDLPIEDLMASVCQYYPHFFNGRNLNAKIQADHQGIDYDIIVPCKNMIPVPHEYPRDHYHFQKAS